MWKNLEKRCCAVRSAYQCLAFNGACFAGPTTLVLGLVVCYLHYFSLSLDSGGTGLTPHRLATFALRI